MIDRGAPARERRPVNRATFALAAAALVLACGSDPPGSTGGSSSSAGSSSTGELASTTGAPDGSSSTSSTEPSSDASSSSAGETGETTETSADTDVTGSSGDAPPFCGDGQLDPGELCDGPDSPTCDADCTQPKCGDKYLNEAAGEQCDDGLLTNTDACLDTCQPASCGDGFVHAGVEECDDANQVDGDGCSGCIKERWSHNGVAFNVPVVDLHGWSLCWSHNYQAGGFPEDIVEACKGDHLLLACNATTDVLLAAAHAPRADVLTPVDPWAGERTISNGTAWFWATEHGAIGMESPKAKYLEDTIDGLMWGVQAGGVPPRPFVLGRRCADVPAIQSNDDAKLYQRRVYEAWD